MVKDLLLLVEASINTSTIATRCTNRGKTRLSH